MSISKISFLFRIVLYVSLTYGTVLHIGNDNNYLPIPVAPIVEEAATYTPEPAPSNVTGFVEDRIIGGELTHITEFPYIVNIEIQNLHSCGGSYIGNYWVLTAAHCITFNKEVILTCSMGMTYLNDFELQQRNATSVHPHKQYNPRNDSNDIGLIKIDSPFELCSKVAIIKLGTEPVDPSVKCRVSGWGVIHQDDMRDRTKLSNQLRFVEVPIISQERCGELYYIDKFRKHFTTDLVFCAGYEEGGFDACQGDSGGPFVCNNILIGVVSWGIGCGNELPGVYTNVTSYLDWIKMTIHSQSRQERRGQFYGSSCSKQCSSKSVAFSIYFLVRCLWEMRKICL